MLILVYASFILKYIEQAMLLLYLSSSLTVREFVYSIPCLICHFFIFVLLSLNVKRCMSVFNLWLCLFIICVQRCLWRMSSQKLKVKRPWLRRIGQEASPSSGCSLCPVLTRWGRCWLNWEENLGPTSRWFLATGAEAMWWRAQSGRYPG